MGACTGMLFQLLDNGLKFCFAIHILYWHMYYVMTIVKYRFFLLEILNHMIVRLMMWWSLVGLNMSSMEKWLGVPYDSTFFFFV
ncbi:hypothetical protein HanPSC8_Chr11g0492371 [Helianthus annuus]|nr:hypothetical protein HanPSC8_Chr11g0492371 [Helianthus annuus]